MKQKRAGFFFYRAIFDSVSQLKKREKLTIYEAIFAYALDMEEPNMEGWSDTAKAIWTLAKPMIDSDLRRYENGCKGGAPRGNTNAQKEGAEKTTEKQPKNNQKQPTNKQEQETRNKNRNNNTLSLSPSDEAGESGAEASSAEREKILEIFFFRNFINPSAEVDRFYAHYEAQGWKRAGGAAITDRIALAQSWRPEKEGERFSPAVADLLAKWYNLANPHLRHLLLTELIDVGVDDSVVKLRLHDSLRLAIEGSIGELAPAFKTTFNNRCLRYSVVTPC